MKFFKLFFGVGGANSDDAPKLLPEGDYLPSYNIRTGSTGENKRGSAESVRGNLLVNYTFPSGTTNKVIGSYEDIEDNAIYYFVYNSSAYHRILRYNGHSSDITEVLVWSGLEFQQIPVIDDITKQGEFLVWIDQNGLQREINVERAITGDYESASDIATTLYKKAPNREPAVLRQWNAALENNYIYLKNYQFASRYIMKDGEYSLLSPLSAMAFSEVMPNETNGTYKSTNEIKVTVTIPAEDQKIVDRVQVLARENNDGLWSIAHTSDSVFDKSATVDTNVIHYYRGDGVEYAVPEDETGRPMELIPKESCALEAFKDRLFLNESAVGYDVRDYEDDITLTLEKKQATASVYPNGVRHFKTGQTRSVGISYADKFGRRTGVIKKQSVEFPRPVTKTYPSSLYEWYDHTLFKRLDYHVGGTVPEWVDSIHILLDKGDFDYCQVPANIFFYVKDDDSSGSPPAGRIVVSGKQYLDDVPASEEDYSEVHLQLPINTPVEPTTDYYIRFLDNLGGETLYNDSFRIKEVIDGFVVINKVFAGPSTSWSDISKTASIEIGRPSQKNEEMYEVAVINTSSTSINTSGSLLGDSFILTNEQDPFTGNLTNNVDDASTFVFRRYESMPDYMAGFDYYLPNTKPYYVESPSRNWGLVGSQKLLNARQGTITVPLPKILGGEKVIPYSFFTQREFRTIDYQRIGFEYGFANVEVPTEKEYENGHVIRYSEERIPDTLINGLSTFTVENKYVIPRERGRIEKLIKADEVLLAIHKRSATSLYFGIDQLRTEDDNDIILKGTDVISRDRVLKGGYGTTYPESVVEHQGRVYWFDFNKAEPIRYSNDGLTPLATVYSFKQWFKQRVDQLAPYRDSINVFAGYDPYFDEVLFAFPEIEGVCEAQVAVFSERTKRWVGVHEYGIEGFSKVGNRLASFKNGELWIHDKGVKFGSFHVKSDSDPLVNYKLVFSANIEPSEVKDFYNLSVESSHKPYRATITTPQDQSTIIEQDDFTLIEGVYYANIMRDMNTPYVQYPLIQGDVINSHYITVELEFDEKDNMVSVYFVNVGYLPSMGHRQT